MRLCRFANLANLGPLHHRRMSIAMVELRRCVSSSRSTASPNVDSSKQPRHHDHGISGNSRHLQQMVASIAPHVPTVFCTLSNIRLRIPEALREAVDEAGGVRCVLESCPKNFVFSKLGSVAVARKTNDHFVTDAQVARDAPDATARNEKRLHHDDDDAIVEQPEVDDARFTTQEDVERTVPLLSTPRFPRFAVPIDVLGSCNAEQEAALLATIPPDVEIVEFSSGVKYARPRGHCISKAFLDALYQPPTTPLLSSVTLTPLETLLIEKGAMVEPCEVYRLARLLKCEEEILTMEREEELQLMLPHRRTLEHVAAASYGRIELKTQTAAEGGGDGGYDLDGDDSTNRPPRRRRVVRYVLPESCALPVHHGSRNRRRVTSGDSGGGGGGYDTYQMDRLEEKIRELRLQKFPPREKIRMMLRQLEMLRSPTPFLDENVFAWALFDSLPEDGSAVSLTAILNRFSPSQRNSRPIRLEEFLQKCRHMFAATQLTRGTNEYHLVRCDSPIAATLQAAAVEEASDEEVVTQLFELYPYRQDPMMWLKLESIRLRIPLRVRQAIVKRGLRQIAMSQHEVLDVRGGTDSEIRTQETEGLRQKQETSGTLSVKSGPVKSTVVSVTGDESNSKAGESTSMVYFRFKGRLLASLQESYAERQNARRRW